MTHRMMASMLGSECTGSTHNKTASFLILRTA